jgi:hypothetical protein
MQVTVIGNSERWLLELQRALDQVINPVRAVKQRVLGMAVQMDERHGIHKDSAGTTGRQS